MKTYVVAALASAACLAGQNASAGQFRSVYTETRSCPVTEEQPDAYIRECTGPGNVKAILQYVEGAFGVFYMPSRRTAPVERGDLLEISPTARFPYGARHEWRIRDGETTACAAIIRAYTTKGERLVVTDLASGLMMGLAKTNSQAVALADKACSGQPVATGQPEEVAANTAPPGVETDADNSPIVQATVLGRKLFSDTYVQTGISGAIEEIEACYGKIAAGGSPKALATCASMDATAAEADAGMTASYPGLAQIFFAGTRTRDRIARGITLLRLAPKEQEDLQAQLTRSLGVEFARSEKAAVQPASVFNFSK